MTNREYFRSAGESIDLCQCLSFADNSVYAVLLGGEIVSLIDNGREYTTVTADDIHRLAVRLNADYDLYKGWNDTHILREAADEKLPCCQCPWFDVCDLMDQEADLPPEKERNML